MGAPIPNFDETDNFVVGDFDGDGDDDLAYRDLTVTAPTGAWQYVVDETAGPGAGNLTTTGVFDNSIQWRNVQVGDFDGDGQDDIVLQNAENKDWTA